MVQVLHDPKTRIVGLKQTLRALLQDRVVQVYLADDADEHIRRKISSACAERGVPIRSAGMNQHDLGTLCEIEVGAAVVALMKSPGT